MDGAMRFDDVNRPERYFSATLAPAILFHDGLYGLHAFVELVDQKIAEAGSAPAGYDGLGARVAWPLTARPLLTDVDDVEVITAFNIARDLSFAGVPLVRPSIGAAGAPGAPPREPDVVGVPFESELADEAGEEREKQDAPDLVLVLGSELIVCEAKFFGALSIPALNRQLLSQRVQVGYLFGARPDLEAYVHIAILPETVVETLDCSAVITWGEVANLASAVLGKEHYVTRRLRRAVEWYVVLNGDPGIRHWDGKLKLPQMRLKCSELGGAIEVGHAGGDADLRGRGFSYARRKMWKWRAPRAKRSAAERKNWFAGGEFLRLIDDLEGKAGGQG